MKDIIEMSREAGYGENLSMLHAVALNRFAELVRADERDRLAAAVLAERQRIVNLLMIQHAAAKGQHNYWHVAANLIEAEYGVHSDD